MSNAPTPRRQGWTAALQLPLVFTCTCRDEGGVSFYHLPSLVFPRNDAIDLTSEDEELLKEINAVSVFAIQKQIHSSMLLFTSRG